MKGKFCYWSIATEGYGPMVESLIRSARSVGVFNDFHVWSDSRIEDATTHPCGLFEKQGFLFKLLFLKDDAPCLNYDYLIWLDADSYFVRNPGDILNALHGSPLHVSLESDLLNPANTRSRWWGCENRILGEFMQKNGVTSKSVFNCNTGFYIIHHDVIETFAELTWEFYQSGKQNQFTFSDEVLMSYAMHMLCGNPNLHLLRHNGDLWASDWTGVFGNALPDGQAWLYTDYLTSERYQVNPALVHVMRSKHLLRDQVALLET